MLQRLDVDLGAGDSVTVYNGDKQNKKTILARYTGDGSDGPRYVMTTGAAACVYMDPTSSQTGRGFKFSYRIGRSQSTKSHHYIISTVCNNKLLQNICVC